MKVEHGFRRRVSGLFLTPRLNVGNSREFRILVSEARGLKADCKFDTWRRACRILLWFSPERWLARVPVAGSQLPSWRNWQTRMVQVHVPARVWGFESLRWHQAFPSLPRRRFVRGFLGDLWLYLAFLFYSQRCLREDANIAESPKHAPCASLTL